MSKVYVVRFSLVLAVAGALCAASAGAQWPRSPVQLSLAHPWQMVADDVDVVGLRLGGYGVNANVTGLDVQLVSHTLGQQTGLQIGFYNRVGGDMGGFQFGLANLVDADFVGWQAGFLNRVGRETRGVQSGPMNMSLAVMSGLQVGVVNYAKDMTGLQLGVFNAAQVMYGVQIGIINIIADKDRLPVLPFINASF